RSSACQPLAVGLLWLPLRPSRPLREPLQNTFSEPASEPSATPRRVGQDHEGRHCSDRARASRWLLACFGSLCALRARCVSPSRTHFASPPQSPVEEGKALFRPSACQPLSVSLLCLTLRPSRPLREPFPRTVSVETQSR